MNLSTRATVLLIGFYLALLAAASLAAVPFKMEEISGWDKAAHLALYFPLGFLLGMLRMPLPGWEKFLVCLLSGALYGGAMELLQSAVPGRTASWGDEAVNTIGLAMGIVIGHSKARTHSSGASSIAQPRMHQCSNSNEVAVRRKYMQLSPPDKEQQERKGHISGATCREDRGRNH